MNHFAVVELARYLPSGFQPRSIAMFAVMLFAAHVAQIWYSLPLIVSISLVYAATRHERMAPILGHAVRLGLWIVGFMAVIFGILFWLQSGL